MWICGLALGYSACQYVREETLRANIDRATKELGSRFSDTGAFPAGSSESAALKLSNFRAALTAKTQVCGLLQGRS